MNDSIASVASAIEISATATASSTAERFD